MTRVLLRWAPAAVGATLLAAGALLLAPVDTELTVRVYLLVVGGLVLLTLLAATAHAAGTGASAFESALVRRAVPRVRPDELARLERRAALAEATAFDFHSRLRPALVDAASAALWRRHAVSLESQPERASALLPAEVWEIVRPDRPRPTDHRAPGIPLDRLDRVVTAIERMSQ